MDKSLESTINAAPIKEKLLDLKAHLPGADESVYEFATYFATELGKRETVTPARFYVTAELTLFDMQRGRIGRTLSPLTGNLVGITAESYNFLRSQIPQIARAVGTEEFADQVQKDYDIETRLMQ